MTLIKDYRRLFLDDVPLLDVRAPVEFERGAFPHATNRPLLNDQEREQVGIKYTDQGNEAAVDLGHQLITGAIRAERVAGWRAFADMNPDGVLYCFRGGQRSEIAQRWLEEEGVEMPRVRGGYKAMRRFLIESIDRLSRQFHLLLLGGRTGVGKTEVLLELDAQVDLEGLANHRGSGFGRRVTDQPSQINFENALAIDLLKREAEGHNLLVLEDESRCIGRRNIPDNLWAHFDHSPVVLLEDSLESRIRRTRREYVDRQLEEFLEHDADDGFHRYADHLRSSLQRIARRLGGKRFQELSKIMDEALTIQESGGGSARHETWIERLLVDYYDPMYDYQIKGKGDRIKFVGSADQVLTYLRSAT
jgi:tRNA 2-selenouridine synthase